MAKAAKKQFLCNKCGSVHPKWAGKCPDCGAWDTLEPFTPPTDDARKPLAASHLAGTFGDTLGSNGALTLDQIDAASAPRTPTGIGELDRVLGGGIVPGAAILVGGEPGIGKSTLLLQMAGAVARAAAARRANLVPLPVLGERLGEGRTARLPQKVIEHHAPLLASPRRTGARDQNSRPRRCRLSTSPAKKAPPKPRCAPSVSASTPPRCSSSPRRTSNASRIRSCRPAHASS